MAPRLRKNRREENRLQREIEESLREQEEPDPIEDPYSEKDHDEDILAELARRAGLPAIDWDPYWEIAFRDDECGYSVLPDGRIVAWE